MASHSRRWSMQKGGITYFAYSPIIPTHLERYGYTEFKPAGYYDYASNTIKDDNDPAVYLDERKAPGA